MLLGSSTLEMALGVALLFLLLALIVTSINEVVARAMALRATTLQEGIGELLADPDAQGIAGLLYGHPLITALERRTRRPSYIHARQFSAALIDAVAEGAASVAAVRQAVETNPQIPDDLKRQLRIILNEAGDNMDDLRKGVGQWFDDAMERVSGWYKRKTQVVTACIAVVLVALLNADALAIADGLLKDPAAREAFVAQASALVPTGTNGVPDISIAQAREALQPLGFRMGWTGVNPGDGFAWLARLVGWLITIFAVMLGAPFWFDLISKIANVRSAGNPPPSTSRTIASEA